MPEGAIYVGRPSDHGNPFIVGERIAPVAQFYEGDDGGLIEGAIEVTADNCLLLFELWARQHARAYPVWIERLRGKDLACWCSLDAPCHADILLRLANLDAAPRTADSQETRA